MEYWSDSQIQAQSKEFVIIGLQIEILINALVTYKYPLEDL